MQDIFEKYMAPNFAALKIPLQILAFDVYALKTKTLNSGSVAKAARASCAVPGLFHPVYINKRAYLDGGIADKMGLSGVNQKDFVVAHSLGKFSGFESPRVNRKKFSNYLELQLKNIPLAGPDRLHLWPQIYTESYLQTKKWLESPAKNLSLFSSMSQSENLKQKNDLTL